jgi:hypothetical protein
MTTIPSQWMAAYPIALDAICPAVGQTYANRFPFLFSLATWWWAVSDQSIIRNRSRSSRNLYLTILSETPKYVAISLMEHCE